MVLLQKLVFLKRESVDLVAQLLVLLQCFHRGHEWGGVGEFAGTAAGAEGAGEFSGAGIGAAGAAGCPVVEVKMVVN